MNLAGLSLRDLEYIVAIAEHGSFRRAAKQCAVAQPSLSGQVRKLEEWLGISIFERTTRRVITTEQGKPVIEQARRVLEEARTLLILARPSGRPFCGSLRLAAISTLGAYLFPRVLPHLRARYPDLALLLGEGRTDDLLTALVAGEHDAVLIALPNPHEAICVAPLFREPFRLASPRDHRAAAAGWSGLGCVAGPAAPCASGGPLPARAGSRDLRRRGKTRASRHQRGDLEMHDSGGRRLFADSGLGGLTKATR